MKHRGLTLALAVLLGGSMTMHTLPGEAARYAAAANAISGSLVQELTLDSAASYAAWSIDTDLQVGDTVYTDRDVTYLTVPDALLGAELVQTSCDAKATTGTAAFFTAGASVTVYVAVDTRVAVIPTWLEGWSITGLTLQNNNSVEYAAYSKAFAPGEIITLGSNNQTSGCVNYVVMATPTAGDVTADGLVDAADAEMLSRYLVCSGDLSAAAGAELSGDDAITAEDLTLLKRMIANREVLPAVTTVTTTTTTPPPASPYEPDGFRFSGKVFLVGDSTVCEYDSNTTSTLDRYGWGMKLGSYFNNVTVRNLALSGRSSRSFLAENYYTTLCNELGEGDYLFIQFGHNDEKTDDADRGTYPGLDWSTLDGSGKNSSGQYSYEWILAKKYIEVAQSKGAVPVLVTPITRRGSDGSANYKGHLEYQAGMFTLGELYGIAVLDMTTQTAELYTELFNTGGASATQALHCITSSGSVDNTHLSQYGATTVAGLIADACVDAGLTLGDYRKN